MTNAKELKARFHEEFHKSTESGNDNTVYTYGMIQALRDMAENDVWPDGQFGDTDCNIWSMFRNFKIN